MYCWRLHYSQLRILKPLTFFFPFQHLQQTYIKIYLICAVFLSLWIFCSFLHIISIPHLLRVDCFSLLNSMGENRQEIRAPSVTVIDMVRIEKYTPQVYFRTKIFCTISSFTCLLTYSTVDFPSTLIAASE